MRLGREKKEVDLVGEDSTVGKDEDWNMDEKKVRIFKGSVCY